MSDFQPMATHIRGYLYITRPQVMKAILTILFVLFLSLNVNAQNTETNDTVEPFEIGAVLDNGVDTTYDLKEVKTTTEKSVARLYKFKNSRVKKALTFTTKKDKPKLV